jgi:inosine-uridine nucleoside N-ribohydrolase
VVWQPRRRPLATEVGQPIAEAEFRGGGRANATVIDQVDAEGFFALLTERLRRL